MFNELKKPTEGRLRASGGRAVLEWMSGIAIAVPPAQYQTGTSEP